MTDSASSGKPSTNTLMLGLMMGGAVALVMLVAVFVYIKTSNKDEEDDDMDPVLRTARHDASKGTTAQTSTLNANYHDNNIQIALAQTNMSLPPMAQTGNSHADSQYSQYSAESSFYANSTYSANPSTVSQVVNKYPGMRQGGENDVAGSEEEESDFEGDSIHDMANTQNEWNTAGRRGTAASGMDQSTVGDSRFYPSDTRSTAASGYHGGNSQFAESEYTEYRMSTGYENSYVNGGQSGYDQSFAASQSGYDQSYAGHKSFESSGFSEYETAAPPRGRGDSTNSDASSFYRTKESSYY
ncbi:hypothetical protein PHYSODRAFT_526562 [Phytophthora sojae]|uniref:Uncharacterized protein n=1 Tax=Phytophthora sojae (strain P6497) TaxID=1094619 RepID=G5A846_PHYSP|nr:hypothetical protein PHYSODRAFT_526562 [Phytophthora sojae]EGZ08072.1 hypothetical protein PHYSODRAFT_526562 [Phytophthora sojae]|eukprot:XP_009536244.1 hypothetical protein PHYSODRAFT_526562 [Phytophthora sojae]